MYAGHTGVADGLIGQFSGAACASGASSSVHGDAAPKIAAAQAPPNRIVKQRD
jgi:glutamate synthase domain-containing protein 3